jgi:DNA invertase Pin-like site-specific DNA recombinase
MTGQIVGYARVSSTDQDLTIQIDQLAAAGCTKIFSEKRTGTKTAGRTELDACLAWVREGDTLMVTRMDRLARSMPDFYRIMGVLREKAVSFKVLLQPEIDTSSANGRLVSAIFAAMAEYETEVRKARQREGIEAARARGVYKDRPGHKGKPPKRRRVRNSPTTPSVAAAIAPEPKPENPPRKGPFGRIFSG